MPNAQARLQIATKIHFFLLRELDHGIDIEKMLVNDRYARDVLLVCEACRGTELAELARQFRQMPPPPDGHAHHGQGSGTTAPPSTRGSHLHATSDPATDLSDFGPTNFSSGEPGPVPPAPAAKRSWLQRLRSR